MELLLRQDVEKLGKRGDMVNVSPGYARNYLIPRGLGAKATAENKRQIELQRQAEERREQARIQELLNTAKKIQSTSETIAAPASPEGHLFGSVTADQIAAAFQADGMPIEGKMIQLDSPLRELGVFTVTVKITPEAKAVTRVWIVAG
ncbi:MAG TPA: 50S ribosomal protein L9 [Planctomycetota bacterium]|nr:50S ribosomal protein L9 [Planctomycetota bacterium]